MTGQYSMSDLEDEYKSNPMPDYFNPDKLPKISSQQIAWWDEKHFDQDGGPAGRNNMEIRIPRNSDGKPDVNGELKPPATKPTWKYVKQARFCMRVAAVKTVDDLIEERRCKIFNYSEKTILNIPQYKKECKKR